MLRSIPVFIGSQADIVQWRRRWFPDGSSPAGLPGRSRSLRCGRDRNFGACWIRQISHTVSNNLRYAGCRILGMFAGLEALMNEDSQIWEVIDGCSRVIATAIHDGHAVRPELAAHMVIGEEERLREEDPFSGALAAVVDTRVIGLRSRFEVDLNRPREKAVYLGPEDAWGLTVYRDTLPDKMVEKSLAEHDAFYRAMHELFEAKTAEHGTFVVLDLHSYNHRRGGPYAEPSSPDENPEVNVGTGTMRDRRQWAGVVDRFIRDLTAFNYDGGRLDVRENVKFFGGHFPAWTHATFPESACVLSVEFKKFFMDEWSSQPDEELLGLIRGALESTVAGLCEELEAMDGK